jgi:hypothetical protein
MQKEIELQILKNNEKERTRSDESYAPIIVKTIVYGAVGTLAGGILFGVADIVINSIKHTL